MRNLRVLLVTAFVGAILGGMVVSTLTSPSGANAEEPRKDYWRNHDGHWCYWHAGDRRWYYTDGTHWFYEEGNVWRPYRFDRLFGREGFERGEYKLPDEKAKIEVPRHEVYRHR